MTNDKVKNIEADTELTRTGRPVYSLCLGLVWPTFLEASAALQSSFASLSFVRGDSKKTSDNARYEKGIGASLPSLLIIPVNCEDGYLVGHIDYLWIFTYGLIRLCEEALCV